MIHMFHLTYSELTTIILFIILAVRFRWKVLELLYNRDTWAVVSVVHCFVMVSGHTWNKMKKPIFSYKANEGPVLISSGQRNQYLAESYIVAVLNGVIVLGMILIIEGAGGIRTGFRGRKRRQIQMLAGTVLMFTTFEILLATFKIKRPWYPYTYLQFVNELVSWLV